MSRLLDPVEIERATDLVKREAEKLFQVARAQLERVKAAEGQPHEVAVRHAADAELAVILRQFTRSQAVLVHTTDERFQAAQAVIGYCDEADARRPSARPVSLGVPA